jgi:hypothetical protein
MDETNPASASARVAVECLTLWLEQDRQRAIDHISNLDADPAGPGPTNLIVGLLNLSAWLVLTLAKERGAATNDELRELTLAKERGAATNDELRELTLAKERGAATDDELREKAGDILHDFSRQLPE